MMHMKLEEENYLREEQEFGEQKIEEQEMVLNNKGKHPWLQKDNQGIGIIEIILILVVIIALIVIFREQITQIVSKAFSSISSGSNEILEDISVNSSTK